jgi:Fe-S-cluster containining protein
VLDQSTLVEADVETGQTQLGALLGLAHELTRAGFDAARIQSMLEGKPMSCTEGCGHCCRRQLVTLAPVEALALAALVDAMPAERQEEVRLRFQAALDRMVEIGIRPADAAKGEHRLVGLDPKSPAKSAMAQYAAAEIPCPFLENERCSIYADRPIFCREHAVSSAPSLCANGSDQVAPLPVPLAVFDALLSLGAEFGTAPRESIPLPAALEWAAVHRDTLSATHDAEQMFHALVKRMQPEQDSALAKP